MKKKKKIIISGIIIFVVLIIIIKSSCQISGNVIQVISECNNERPVIIMKALGVKHINSIKKVSDFDTFTEWEVNVDDNKTITIEYMKPRYSTGDNWSLMGKSYKKINEIDSNIDDDGYAHYYYHLSKYATSLDESKIIEFSEIKSKSDKTSLNIFERSSGMIVFILYLIANNIIFSIPCILVCIILFWSIYQDIYYKSENFKRIKNKVQKHIKNCNELNSHIEELKNAYVKMKKTDYGKAEYYDDSNYNYSRQELKKNRELSNVYDCSLSVCRNAKLHPFKYVCKYFNIKADEESLSNFESILNDFSAAEEGIILLSKERDKIIASISEDIPSLIKSFSKKRLERELGFAPIDFRKIYFPEFIFRYVSAGGNSSMVCNVVFDIENLNRFITYLAESIKFKKSVAGQRALMTTALREKIKKRPNYTCKYCGNSTKKEPNLLLEIDHITPLSKNGLTTEDNLQTLCWKCNRTKGSKIVESANQNDNDIE